MNYESARIETAVLPISAADAYARCFDCRSCNRIVRDLDLLRSLEEEDYMSEIRFCGDIDNSFSMTSLASPGTVWGLDLVYLEKFRGN